MASVSEAINAVVQKDLVVIIVKLTINHVRVTNVKNPVDMVFVCQIVNVNATKAGLDVFVINAIDIQIDKVQFNFFKNLLKHL